MTAYAYDTLPPDAPVDFALRLGDLVRVETATPAIPFVGRITERLKVEFETARWNGRALVSILTDAEVELAEAE